MLAVHKNTYSITMVNLKKNPIAREIESCLLTSVTNKPVGVVWLSAKNSDRIWQLKESLANTAI